MIELNATNDSPRLLWGLLRRRQCVALTWRGWLLALLILGTAATLAVRNAYYFLAVTDPVPGGILVVEGWGPDFFLKEAIEEFRRNHYQQMLVTGGPLGKGTMFAQYKTYAEFSVAELEALGFDHNLLHAIPAEEVSRDRTYTSAMAVKNWLKEQGMNPASLTLMSMGTHSRRSRLLYEKTFGSGVKVGIIAVRDGSVDPHRWWTTSQGFRSVTDEMIAYIYARFLFQTPTE
jgi:hypothetical protein